MGSGAVRESCNLKGPPVQCSVVQCIILTNSALHCSNVQYHKVLYGAVQCSTVQYSMIQYNTVQYSTIQYATVQYSMIQYNTVQCNTIQYDTVQCSTMCRILRCSALGHLSRQGTCNFSILQYIMSYSEYLVVPRLSVCLYSKLT